MHVILCALTVQVQREEKGVTFYYAAGDEIQNEKGVACEEGMTWAFDLVGMALPYTLRATYTKLLSYPYVIIQQYE